MPDYNLGRASGRIEIDFDGTGTSKAIHDLDKATDSSGKLDKQLTKTEKTLHDTDKQMGKSSGAAQGYSARLREVRESSANVDRFEKAYQRTLLDSKASLSDIKQAHDKVTEAKKRHTQATNAERDANKALAAQLSVGKNAMSALGDVIPALTRHLSSLGSVEQSVSEKTSGLAKGLGLAAKGLALLGPEGKAASVGVELAAKGVDKMGSSATTAGGHIGNFVKELANFELAVGKIGGITLGATALGGLAGIAGGAGLMGLTEMADAVKQLSGALGLLPAAIAGVGFSALTLKVAFHGVGDAIKDMMADDPKKFLEDIQNMGPVAARSMLQIAQFRDQFKLAGAVVQDSFFAKIAADIAPLIQTWLPAMASGMSRVAGIFGDFAHQFAGIMEQPATMTAFKGFIDSLAGGLRALQPAMGPLVHMFETLTTVGASFFPVIGQMLTSATSFFDKIVSKAAASGALQEWITTGIDAFAHLGNILYQVGAAFLNIMNVADKFGGGGLLGFLDDLTNSIAGWTESADGQKALTEFFSTLRQATDAFLPMLKPLVEGFMSIGKAFVDLGVATAPAWLDLFKTFASVMAQMAPSIVATAPAIAEFLQHMAAAMIRMGGAIGPELPRIFQVLADAFVALLPQLPPLVKIFTQLIEQVGPQMPKLFQAVTDALVQLTSPRVMPALVELFRVFVSAVTLLVEVGGGVIEFFREMSGAIDDVVKGTGKLLDAIGNWIKNVPGELSQLGDTITRFFEDFPRKALQWGKNLVQSLIKGMLDPLGLTGLGGAASSIVDQIARWFQKSPAEVGPFSGSGYTLLRGQKMVTDMAVGMVSARGAVAAAGRATAQAAAGGLASGTGGGGAPSPGGASSVGNALQPDNIANADQSPLDAYLNHQFPENRGLKGLAKNMGALLSVAQNGFNLAYQHIYQPLMQLAQGFPGANQQTWRKMTPAQQAAELAKKAGQQGAGWGPLLGGGAAATQNGQVDFPWDLVAKAESSGNWQNADTGRNGHFGGLQFSPETWKAFGGLEFAARPDLATREQQITVADRTAFTGYQGASPQGLGAWEVITKGMVPGVTVNTPRGQGPSWLQALGGAAPSVPRPNPDVIPSGPQRVQIDGQPVTPAPPAAGVPGAPLTTSPTGRPIYTGPHTTNTNGAIVPNAAVAEAIIRQMFPGVTINNDWRPEDGFNEHSSGEAVDFSINPGGAMGTKTPEGQALGTQLKDFLVANAKALGLQYAIWQGMNWDPDGSSNPNSGGGITGGHWDHVHGRFLPGPAVAPGASAAGLSAPLSGGDIPLPGGQTVTQLLTQGNTVNQQQLQAYLQGNPALADQINAAKTPGANDQQVLGALNGISSTITQLQQQDATGNAGTISALQATQQQIASQGGFTQGQSGLQSALSIGGAIGSGAANAITGAFQVVSSGLDAAAGTQDIADRLVYGVRGTQDVSKILDDFQKYITFAANIASEVGNVLTSIGSVVSLIGQAGASASLPTGGDPGAAAAAVGQGFQFAGMIASVISGVLQGINTAIDYVQQVNQIIGGYVGRFLSNLTAGPFGGTPLMGNVRMLLNTNTGQLVTYSEDNPQNQNVLSGSSFLNALYGFGSANPNPQVNTQWNLYAGPGEPVGRVLNQAAFMVESGATTGANGPQNY